MPKKENENKKPFADSAWVSENSFSFKAKEIFIVRPTFGGFFLLTVTFDVRIQRHGSHYWHSVRVNAGVIFTLRTIRLKCHRKDVRASACASASYLKDEYFTRIQMQMP